MGSLIDFKKLAEGLSNKFGASAAETTVRVEATPTRLTFTNNRYRSKQRKWQRYTGPQITSRPITYNAIDIDIVKYCLLHYLRFTGYDFVLSGFTYQGSKMDAVAIHSDRVIEFQTVPDIDAFSREFKKTYRLGKFPVSKHSFLEQGKGLPNFFYFVAPAGMLVPDDLPEHAGLISYHIPDGRILPVFNIERVSPILHKDRIPAGTYKHVARKFQTTSIAMERKASGSFASFADAVADRTEQTNELPL